MSFWTKKGFMSLDEIITKKQKSKIENIDIIEKLDEILKTLKTIEKELKQNAREGTVTNAITKETNRIK